MAEITEDWLIEHKFEKHCDKHYRRSVHIGYQFTVASLEAHQLGRGWFAYYSVNGYPASQIKYTREGIEELYISVMREEEKNKW